VAPQLMEDQPFWPLSSPWASFRLFASQFLWSCNRMAHGAIERPYLASNTQWRDYTPSVESALRSFVRPRAITSRPNCTRKKRRR